MSCRPFFKPLGLLSYSVGRPFRLRPSTNPPTATISHSEYPQHGCKSHGRALVLATRAAEILSNGCSAVKVADKPAG